MAQNLAELCTCLIENQVGELDAQIFTTLAEHGRLTVPTLAAHTKIPTRRVRSGLALLLEEQLVFQIAAADDAPAFYSVNWRNAYNLARHTNIIELVKDRHGEHAGTMVGNILQLGNARVGDLADAYSLMPASKRDSGVDTSAARMPGDGLTNGTAKPGSVKASHEMNTSELHSTLRALLRSGVLAKVGLRTYIAPSDLQDQIEESVISDQFPDRKVTGPKKQREFKLAINVLKRKWREDDAYSELHDGGSRGAMKRPGDYFKNDSKRVKINGNHANGLESEQPTSKLSDDLVVRVDFSRCTMAMRSRRLEQHAKRYLGGVTAAVYGALLQTLEGKTRAVHNDLPPDDDDDEESHLPVCTISEVAEILDPTINLDASIKGLQVGKNLTNGTGKNSKKNGIKRELSDSEDEPTMNGYSGYADRAKRLSLIEAHLALLEEHNTQYCKRVRTHGSNEWRVDFPALTATLVEAELDSTIQARYGKLALRVVRMLRQKGKLEEKQVASCAMMRIKDIRALLTDLQFRGVLEAQELPKDNARQPSRTLYLWFFDTFRVQQLILQQTYKAMARTLQRVPVERERYRTVIEKAERTDVKGQEHEKLEQAEKQALREWREVEERLMSQVDRMDLIVALLRDFSGKDTSLTT